MNREEEIKYVLHTWKQCCYLEHEHRWYYDEYAVQGKEPTQRERLRAYYYKEKAAFYKNWRHVLYVAEEIGLPLPAHINLKRYTDI